MLNINQPIHDTIAQPIILGTGFPRAGFILLFSKDFITQSILSGTFTRASTSPWQDSDGNLRLAVIDQPVYPGRRLSGQNYLTWSEDMVTGNYIENNGAVIDSATQATFDGGINGNVYQPLEAIAGSVFLLSVEVKLISGTPAAGSSTQLRIDGVGITSSVLDLGSSLTTEWQRFHVTSGAIEVDANLQNKVLSHDSVVLGIRNWQLEQVATGVTTPRDYTKTTDTAPVNVTSPYDINGTLIPNLLGWQSHDAIVNKCQTFGFIPDDAEQTPLTSGVMTKGVVYKIKVQSSTTSLIADGASNPHAVGDTFVATGNSITLTATDSVAQIKYATGTKSLWNGVDAFIQNIDGMTLSGDVAGVLSIGQDTAALDAAGYGGPERNGKFLRLVGVDANAYIVATGATGNTNKHSLGAVARKVSGVQSRLEFNDNVGTVQITSVTFVRILSEDITPGATRLLRLMTSSSSILDFLLPGLYEQSYAPYLPVPANSLISSTTQARTNLIYTYPAGSKHAQIVYTHWGLNVGTAKCVWSNYTDAANYIGVFINGAICYVEKKVAGVSEYVAMDFVPVQGIQYLIEPVLNADNTMQLSIDSVGALSGLGANVLSGDAASDDTDSVGMWISMAGVGFTSQSSVVHSGSFALEYDVNTTPTADGWASLNINSLLTAGKQYLSEAWVRHSGVGGAVSFGITNRWNVPGSHIITSTDTTFSQYNDVFEADWRKFFEMEETSATNDGGAYIDSQFIKQIHNTSTTLAPILSGTMELGSLGGASNADGFFESLKMLRS
jgi:hypothetical protein